MSTQELILLAHVSTESVNDGFLPAARRLGLSPVLLTDQAEAHRQHFSQGGLPAYPETIIACDVFNPLAVIEAINRRGQKPAAIFSNSDHLQTSTAIAADYFNLPGKDWHVTYRAKNKAEMRAYLREHNIQPIRYAVASEPESLTKAAADVGFPCVVKPREGVASQEVALARDYAELAAHCLSVWQARPGQVMLLEEYIEGPLCTLETLGDGQGLRALGGFHVRLSAPPHFVELEADWSSELAQQQDVLDRIVRFGVGFGACHTEFVLAEQGPRLIEINYRSIGDRRDFLLEQTLGIPLFETVLRLHLGEPLSALPLSPRAAAIRYLTPATDGRIVSAPASFMRSEAAADIGLRVLRQAGDTIAITHSNKDYLGVLTGVGTDADAVHQALAQARAGLAWEIRS
ncbi:siderophore biosynthesis protein [Candidatus Methylobacter oryzae]|uniref:Siderophore biosynthesis protein n=1 Tax=Candidatus Methylobacter oryzae TaxID=2497749 RepID=A0ABY3C5V8_9GAMM|nr:siderophore biosynthesis protein [Candidatus Methylobacter oryzae]TRW90646.1 siderophore biosynthesis protein [Candidatus Methylobacter oryzae]